MTDLHKDKAIRTVSAARGFADRGRPALLSPPIDEFPSDADASDVSIIEQLAAPDAADIEFEAPSSGRLFLPADFS